MNRRRISAWSPASTLIACEAADEDESSEAPNTSIAFPASSSDAGSDSDAGSASDSDSDSESGPQGNCPTDDHELLGTLELTTLQIGGQHMVTPEDLAAGGVACVDFGDDGGFMLTLDFGTKSGADHESRIVLVADNEPRSYDFATEAGMGPGRVQFEYSITIGAGTGQYGWQSSPRAGTIDIVATAFDDPTFDFSAVGHAGADEHDFVFDLRFVGEWADK